MGQVSNTVKTPSKCLSNLRYARPGTIDKLSFNAARNLSKGADGINSASNYNISATGKS